MTEPNIYIDMPKILRSRPFAGLSFIFACVSMSCLGLLMLILSPQKAEAEVFRPIQIFLPGNLQGKLSELTPDNKFTHSDAWKLPDIIAAFKKDRTKDHLVLAIGNDSDLYAPLSFIDSGRFERELIGRCNPEAGALTPADLEMFNTARSAGVLGNRIFTNLDNGETAPLFKHFFVKKLSRGSLWFFNFVAASWCKELPRQTLVTSNVDSPVRALKRLNPQFDQFDISLSLIYDDQAAIAALTRELKTRPGHHLLIQMPSPGHSPSPASWKAEPDGNVFTMSLQPGYRFLPMLSIFRRYNGTPRISLRMLPLASGKSENARYWSREAMQRIKPALFETLRVIKTTSGPTTKAWRFSDAAFSYFLRSGMSADLAIVVPPEIRHLDDNFVTAASPLHSFPNDLLFSFRLSGNELQKLGETLAQNRGLNSIIFSGCEFSALGGQMRELRVSGQPVAADRFYTIVTTRNTLKDPAIARSLVKSAMADYDGNTLWNLWQIALKTIRISDDNLFD